MDSATTVRPSSFGSAGSVGAAAYTLSSDLARFCLPAASRDSNLKFAWANSICFLFLVIGLIGLKNRPINVKPLPELQEIIPVVFVPPPVEQPPDPERVEREPEPAEEVSLDQPQVATVVAIDSANVGFAVPVEGPVVFAPAKFASAPPAQPPKKSAPPSVTVFRPGTGGRGGTFPRVNGIPYDLIQAARSELVLFAEVGVDGIPSKLEVRKSSGSFELDRRILRHVQNKYRWDPGSFNLYEIPFLFQ